MLYSNCFQNQIVCYSHFPGWQPDVPMRFGCTDFGEEMQRQQSGRQNEDTNFFHSMKNPRKSSANPVGNLPRALDNVHQDIDDLPFVIAPSADLKPQEPISPEEESFRTFLHSRLSRHKAPAALRERIKNAIKNMPD